MDLSTRRTLLKIGLAGLLAPFAFSACTHARSGSEFERWRADFEARVAERMRQAHVVGAAVAITSRDSTARYTGAFGYADLGQQRTFTVDTPTHLASVSKLFTASALVQLFDRRGHSLDDDINTFLNFPVRNPRHPQVPITPRHLLTHTSSISDEGYGDVSTPGDPTQDLAEFLRNYLADGTAFSPEGSFLTERPGVRWDYSNVGMALAGHVVEVVSGQRFSAYVQDNIFGPLNISNAHWYLNDFAPNVTSTPYEFDNGAFTALPQQGYPDVPAGMLRCSANDLATSLRAMIGGKGGGSAILAPASVQAMLRPQVGPPITPYQGLGWTQEEVGGHAVIGHSGSDIGASNMVALTPDKAHAVCVLMNIDGTEQTDEFRSSVTEDLLAGAQLIS